MRIARALAVLVPLLAATPTVPAPPAVPPPPTVSPRTTVPPPPARAAEWFPPSTFAPPPESLSLAGGAVRFLARGFVYETADTGETWQVETSRHVPRPAPLLAGRRFITDTTGVQTIFQSLLDRDAARLTVMRFQEGRLEPVSEAILYDRWAVEDAERRVAQRRVLLTPADTLARTSPPSAALLTPVHVAGTSAWLGIGWESGRRRGVGAIARHDLATGVIQVFRPKEFESGSVARIALTPGAVWLSLEPPARDTSRMTRLLSFDPLTEKVTDWTEKLGAGGAPIAALATVEDTLWVSAGASLARVTDSGRKWRRWRIEPVVRLPLRELVSSIPGQASSRALSSGSYVVLGGGADSLLLRTPDGAEGWLAPGAARESLLALRDMPDSLAAITARFPRSAAMELLPLRTADGWQRARVHAGWIARRDLTVRPTVIEQGTGPQ